MSAMTFSCWISYMLIGVVHCHLRSETTDSGTRELPSGDKNRRGESSESDAYRKTAYGTSVVVGPVVGESEVGSEQELHNSSGKDREPRPENGTATNTGSRKKQGTENETDGAWRRILSDDAIADEAEAGGVAMADLLHSRNDGAKPTHRMPVIWAHVSKAGGSLMCAIAQKEGEVVDGTERNCNTHMTDEADDCTGFRSYFERHGYTYTQIEEAFKDSFICEGFHYGVMLREPVSLANSAINFVDLSGSHLTTLIDCMKRGEICDNWPEARITEQRLDNFHIRHLLSPEVKEIAIGQVTDDHANRVIAKLEKSFEVVTILEEMELNTPEILNRAFGWSLSFPLTKANPSQHKLAFTSEQEAFVRQLNTHDYKVYNYFKAKPPNQRGLTKTLD